MNDRSRRAEPRPDGRADDSPSVPSPRTRSAPTTRLRTALAGRLPVERPRQVPEREWRVLVAVVNGRSLRDVGDELGLSKERVRQLAARAHRRLEGTGVAAPWRPVRPKRPPARAVRDDQAMGLTDCTADALDCR